MSHSTYLIKLVLRLTTCVLLVAGLSGCSVFQSSSYFIEAEPAVSPQALASADDAFVAAPFSLIAADSVGLATFGFEIAQWDDPQTLETFAQQD